MMPSEATSERLLALFPHLSPEHIRLALEVDGKDAGLAIGYDTFDSELLHKHIGRVVAARAPDPTVFRSLYESLGARMHSVGLDQVIRRVDAGSFPEIWALGHAGFELMDIGVTFGRRITEPLAATTYGDLEVRPASRADLEEIIPAMVERPWGSRYESDPSYRAEDVRALRGRWLWNSYAGRAQLVLIGVMDSQPAGYVTCLLDAATKHGEIELVGTLPRFRGRRVAARIIEQALAWFSTRSEYVTVRTQATNYAAANLYEKNGFGLNHSDLTFRLARREREVL
jgi:ribosomal protein S18 acetylase RimI-like enzyme